MDLFIIKEEAFKKYGREGARYVFMHSPILNP